MFWQSYRNWLSVLDKEKFEAITDRKVWFFILATFSVIIFLLAEMPIVAEFFQLKQYPVWLSLGLVTIFALLVSSTKLRSSISWEANSFFMLSSSATFQFFMWSLVCSTELPGAAMLAALPILLTAYHGEFYQLSLRYPWGGITTVLALIGAMAIAPDNDHRAIVLIGGIISLGAAIAMGNHSRIHYQSVKERDAMKAAIDAQTLLDQVRETEQTQNLMYEIRGANHDAGNALSGVLMNLDLIKKIVSSDEISPEDIQEIREMSVDLEEGSSRLRYLIEKGRQVGKQAADCESVDIIALAQSVLNEVKTSFPNTTQSLEIDNKLPSSYFLKLHGGELTLNRVLSNILINAHEGNGNKQATHVTLGITEDESHLEIKIKDDGPGFSDDQLKQSIANFKTTKETGTGLGLYTSLRLISANHGGLEYTNNADGGACVRIRFPRDSE